MYRSNVLKDSDKIYLCHISQPNRSCTIRKSDLWKSVDVNVHCGPLSSLKARWNMIQNLRVFSVNSFRLEKHPLIQDHLQEGV